MDDEELVVRIRDGDENAAEELVKRYYVPVFRYCRWHCADRERAEDLTQETFLRLFKGFSAYNSRKKFKAYLYTIASHLCIDESRKRTLYPLEDTEWMESEKNEITQAENREVIARLLSFLSEEQREAVILRFVSELSYLEIARVTGCTMRTAQSRVRNALRIMRKELENEE